MPLVVHFHGASWLIEQHVARAARNAALITVNLGSRSARYAAPFADAARFAALLDEAADAAGYFMERPTPAVDVACLAVLTRMAADAGAGRRRFWGTHSEADPGTYASTTDTANALLASLGLTRRIMSITGMLWATGCARMGSGSIAVPKSPGRAAGAGRGRTRWPHGSTRRSPPRS